MKKLIPILISAIFISIILISGLYPTVSDYINSRSQTRVVGRYLEDVEKMDDENKEEMLAAAREYNMKLLYKKDRLSFTEEETAEYKKQLDTGRGVMGILEIDKINVMLPIYHGTDEGVLQIGIGHMQGTSLPIGGKDTHAFITGHRGLPSSKLLTNLDKMTYGDIFVLRILDETLTYQVDNIQTIEPDNAESLEIVKDMDYCTLVTCTPYGINTHRLLVRGQRIENIEGYSFVDYGAGARQLDKLKIILIFIIPALPVLTIFAFIIFRRIQKGGKIYR